MATIELRNVSFIKNKITILKDINLTIADREYITIVGSTGSGKTSLLGLISGLYKPTSGDILLDGKIVTHLPPNERHCGVMFESYALFPHLTVLDNVSYARHMNESDHDKTYSIATEIINLVRLNGRETTLPQECSGGMQQRVALARAIMALESGGVLLLDEPFKALDAGLRTNLRREVRNIAKSEELHLTTIHITNEMQEAMIGDRIVVLDHGQVRQIGTPREIMYEPIDLFVANFFSTELNYFSGKIISKEVESEFGIKQKPLEKIVILTPEGYFLYAKTERSFQLNEEVTFLLRSQYFNARHKRRDDKTNSFFGIVKRAKFMGAWLRLELEVPAQYENLPELPPGKKLTDNSVDIILLRVEVPTTRIAVHNFVVGETITVYFPSQYVIVFPKISESELQTTLKVS